MPSNTPNSASSPSKIPSVTNNNRQPPSPSYGTFVTTSETTPPLPPQNRPKKKVTFAPILPRKQLKSRNLQKGVVSSQRAWERVEEWVKTSEGLPRSQREDEVDVSEEERSLWSSSGVSGSRSSDTETEPEEDEDDDGSWDWREEHEMMLESVVWCDPLVGCGMLMVFTLLAMGAFAGLLFLFVWWTGK